MFVCVCAHLKTCMYFFYESKAGWGWAVGGGGGGWMDGGEGSDRLCMRMAGVL